MSKNLSIAYAVKRKAKKMASGGEVKKPQQSDSFAEKLKQGMGGVFNSGGLVGKIMAKRKLDMDQDEELMSDEMDPMSDEEMEMMADGGEVMSEEQKAAIKKEFKTPQQQAPSPSPSKSIPSNQAGSDRADDLIRNAPDTLEELHKRQQNKAHGGLIKNRISKILSGK